MTTSNPHRFAELRDAARQPGATLADQVAAQRRAVLESVAALADALAVPGAAAAEGLTPAELAALRSLGLRLAAAADARLAD